jgi:hypothetical protein
MIDTYYMMMDILLEKMDLDIFFLFIYDKKQFELTVIYHHKL